MKSYKLKNYVPKNYAIASVAKSKVVADKLLGQEQNVLLIEKTVCILPIRELITVSNEDMNWINELNEYDVIALCDDGRILTLYEVSSSDNVLLATNNCNSNCIMCPSPENWRRSESEFKLSDLLSLVKHIPDDTQFLTITGGEPSLIKEDLFTLLDSCKNKFERTKFLLLTNGREFSSLQYCEKFFEVAPKGIRIGIPIYAPDSQRHDYITQAKKSFDQAVQGIKHLLKYKAEVELRIVVSKLNFDVLCDLALFCSENFKGVDIINFMGLEMCGNAAKNADIVWMGYKELFPFVKEAVKILVKSGFDIKIYNFPLCMVEKGYWSMCAQSISDYKVRYQLECEDCLVKPICGGIFNTTLAFSKMRVFPIKE